MGCVAAPQHDGTARHCSGRASPAMRRTFRRKSRSTRSSDRRYASSRAETNYKDSPSAFGIRMADRISGKPLHIDISDLPMKRGVTTEPQQVRAGPSGSGKSFFMNHLVRQYFEQGSHVVLVDTGNSYQGLWRDDTSQDQGQGRHLLHLHGGQAHLVQPVLHGRRGVRRGEEGQHQDACCSPCGKARTNPPQKRSRRNWAAR